MAMAWIYQIGVNKPFSNMGTEQINNATEVWAVFNSRSATLQSACGLLGNMCAESGLNPGNKQGSSPLSGWGLIQWTPSTDLTRWCTEMRLNWYDGAAQMERIIAEGLNIGSAAGFWYPTSAYPYTWQEFEQLTDVEEATKAYLYERERAGTEVLPLRIQYALDWYTYFTGQPTPPPSPTPPTPYKRDSGMPVYMMTRRAMLRM